MSLLVILSLILCSFKSVSSQEIWTDTNFEASLRKTGMAFVKFYAPWCGHCKKLEPTWKELSKAPSIKIPIVKVDCTADGKKTCERINVKGFPTLKLVSLGVDGEEILEDYEGDRSYDAFVSFVESHTLPSYIDITSESIDIYVSPEKRPSLIGFFSSKDSPILKKLMTYSQSLRDIVSVVYTLNSKTADSVSQKIDTIVLYRESILSTKLEAQFHVIQDLDDIKSEVMNHIHGTVGFRRANNLGTIKFPHLIAYVDVNPKFDPSRFKMIRNRLIKISKSCDLKVYISSISEFEGEIRELPIVSPRIVVMIFREDKKRYLLEESFSSGNMNQFTERTIQFLEDYKTGKLQVYIKSAAEPLENDGHVKIVVGSTFEKIVMDESKDVLIELYAPWCGHCKQLAPKYKELAEKLIDQKHIVIAKMDATTNDSPPQYPVKGFPTIFFAPKGSKKSPIPYNGGREVPEFIDWLKKHSTEPFTKSDSGARQEL